MTVPSYAELDENEPPQGVEGNFLAYAQQFIHKPKGKCYS